MEWKSLSVAIAQKAVQEDAHVTRRALCARQGVNVEEDVTLSTVQMKQKPQNKTTCSLISI